MQRQILILGWRWMLWSMLSNFLKKQWYLIDITVSSLPRNENEILLSIHSVEYIKRLELILSKGNYEFVINCIAILRWDISNPKEVAQCFLVNWHLPRTLSYFANQFGYKNIHISTNWVFSSGHGMYCDNEIPNDTSLYGITKIAWEVFSDRTLILRTSIIWTDYINKGGFLEWVISHKSNETITGYENVFWNGVTTLTLSEIIEYIIESKKNDHWILHIAGELISKKVLIWIISETFECNLSIISDKSISENRTLSPSLSAKSFQYIIAPILTQVNALKNYSAR